MSKFGLVDVVRGHGSAPRAAMIVLGRLLRLRGPWTMLHNALGRACKSSA